MSAGSALGVVASAIRTTAGVLSGEPPEARYKKLEARVAQSVPSSNDMQVSLAVLPGVAIVPEGYRELFTDSVVFRPLKPNPDPMGLWFWWRKGDEGSAVAAFRAALRESRDVS